MTKVLILGGSGILSTAVAQEAVNKKMDVTCLTTGRRDYLLPNGVKSIHGDANRPESFLELLDDKYDSIIDFLSYNAKQLASKLKQLYTYTNQYIFVSSATAYKIIDEEITEECPLGNQYWDYSENKIICEKYLKDFCREKGIMYTIVRPYVTYGNTRIPFSIIPDQYWSLANRILCDKPILIPNNGEAVCNITHTSDFSKGFVALVDNPKAFMQAFHITSDERITWSEILDYTSDALGRDSRRCSYTIQDICAVLPEYAGVLEGDKGRNRIFNNMKISSVAPDFSAFKPFKTGILETIEFYNKTKELRVVNYIWDGRIDWAIIKLKKECGEKINKAQFKYASVDKGINLINRVKYLIGRNEYLYLIYIYLRNKDKLSMILKAKKTYKEKLRLNNRLHYLGYNFVADSPDFGDDGELISIGNNVRIMRGAKFINYRPSAEFFNKILRDGTDKKIRDLGPISIGNNVFVGQNVTFYGNAKIGNNCMVLDGSVVIDEIPNDSVVIGNPAKRVCSINEWYDDVIKRNMQYPWYSMELNHDEIVKMREDYFWGCEDE